MVEECENSGLARVYWDGDLYLAYSETLVDAPDGAHISGA